MFKTIKIKRVALFFLIPLGWACAGPAVIQQPTSMDNGALSACVFLLHEDWPNFFAHPANEVVWAQEDSKGNLDPDHPIIANAGKDGCLYAVNVPAGVYAPISASSRIMGLRFFYRFHPELIKDMTVQVKPGQFVFFGKIYLNTETEDASVVLKNIWLRLRKFLPPFKSFAVPAPVGYPHLDRGPLAEAHSLRIARDIFADTLWRDPIEQRLAQIGSPMSPILKGPFWNRREVDAINVSSFSYIDTLKWGRARRIEGGAEWRQPKGKARIAVQFLDPTMRGYQEESVYLEKMREAGIPSDSHSLFSVHVSTYFGKGARYTSYVYPEQDLPGAVSQVFITETWLIPKGPGYYLIHYRAKRRYFNKFYARFKKFMGYLSFERKVKKEDSYP